MVLVSRSLLVDTSLSGKTLMERFELELQRTAASIKANTVGIARLVFGTVFIAASGIAATIWIVPAFVIPTVLICCLFLKAIFRMRDSIKKMDSKFESGEIFTELLVIDGKTREITDEKIAIFKKYGNMCKRLRLCKDVFDDASTSYSGIAEIFPAFPLGHFFIWVRDGISKIKDQGKQEKLKIICDEFIDLFNELNQKFGTKLCALEKGSIIQSIIPDVMNHAIIANKYQLKIASPYEDSKSDEFNQESQQLLTQLEENVKRIKEKIIIPSSGVLWDIDKIVEVIKQCPNLQELEVDENFHIGEIFTNFKGKIVQNKVLKIPLDIKKVKSLKELWQEKYAGIGVRLDI